MTLLAPTTLPPMPAALAPPGGCSSYRPSSRERLTTRDLHHFQGSTLFDHVARVVCEASCLPRKELYESWEVARRAR